MEYIILTLASVALLPVLGIIFYATGISKTYNCWVLRTFTKTILIPMEYEYFELGESVTFDNVEYYMYVGKNRFKLIK